MFDKIFDRKPSELQEPIDAVLESMSTIGPDDDRFEDYLTQLERLEEMKRNERGPRISPETLATVGGNLLGILIIVKYEQFNVLASKALGMVQRGRTNP